MSQETFIYDQVQTQCCQFFILIKKELMFFLQRVVGVLCHAGAPIYNWKNLKKWKNKKLKRDYVQIQKVKTKNITNESLRVPYVIDQCSRGDRTCG